MTNIINGKKAAIFDMDGTLVDSMWLWKQIDIDFFNMYNLPFPDDLQKQIEGMSFVQTAHYFKNNFAFPCSTDEMMEIWNKMAHEKYKHEVEFKKGAVDFLIMCKRYGLRLGIATSNSRFLFDAVKEHLQLDKYFDCMLTGTEITNGKPAPDVFLKVAERLNVNPCDCLVFEDIIPGIMAGKNAGMTVCAVDDAYSFRDKDSKIKLADYFIEDYTELIENE